MAINDKKLKKGEEVKPKSVEPELKTPTLQELNASSAAASAAMVKSKEAKIKAFIKSLD